MCIVQLAHFKDMPYFPSLVPRLPQFFNVTCRKTREPGKLFHVRDIGIEATWSMAHANHDLALLGGHQGSVKDHLSQCTNDCFAN